MYLITALNFWEFFQDGSLVCSKAEHEFYSDSVIKTPNIGYVENLRVIAKISGSIDILATTTSCPNC